MNYEYLQRCALIEVSVRREWGIRVIGVVLFGKVYGIAWYTGRYTLPALLCS